MRHAALTWLAFLAMTIGLAISVSPSSAIADTNPKPLRIVAFGDSLVAGYGLRPGEAFPDRLQKALAKKGLAVTVLNSGVSGDTTSGGLARFDWAVPTDVDAVILELGANDMLRGLPPEKAHANLRAILKRIEARGVPALIAGMRAPSNWGRDYQEKFNGMYADLAKEFDAILYPFFLAGVVQRAGLNQADGIHPNAKGVDVIVERILPSVLKLIERVRAS